MNDLEKAKKLLAEGFTIVLCRGDKVYTSIERGVSPLISMLEKKIDLKGFSAADKVVGKAAAMLFVLCGVSEVFAAVATYKAKEILEKNGIKLYTDNFAEHIKNRAGNGFCPMEIATSVTDDPKEGFIRIKQKLLELKSS